MTTACALYSEAKKALNASAPERVICRSSENEKLYDYLDECFAKKKTMSIYVNGQPGTGKTLTITHLLDEFKVIPMRFFLLNVNKVFRFLIVIAFRSRTSSNRFS